MYLFSVFIFKVPKRADAAIFPWFRSRRQTSADSFVLADAIIFKAFSNTLFSRQLTYF